MPNPAWRLLHGSGQLQGGVLSFAIREIGSLIMIVMQLRLSKLCRSCSWHLCPPVTRSSYSMSNPYLNRRTHVVTTHRECAALLARSVVPGLKQQASKCC